MSGYANGSMAKKTYELLFIDGSGAMNLNRVMIHEYLRMTLDYIT